MHPILISHQKPRLLQIGLGILLLRFTRGNSLTKAFLLVAFLSGCAAGTGSVPIESRDVMVEQFPQPAAERYEEDDYVSTPIEQRDYEIQQAERYQDIARAGSQFEAINATLSAAEFYIQANDSRRAEEIISELNFATLDAQQRNRYEIIIAYAEFSRGEILLALSRMQNLLQNTENQLEFSRQQQVDALLLSSFCYQELSQYGDAISVLIERESLLFGEARAETSRYIWQVIDALSLTQRQQVIATTTDLNVRNRLEQSLQGQVGDIIDQPKQFDIWRDRGEQITEFATPGKWGPESPRTIAILLPQSSRYAKAAQAVVDGIQYQHSLNNSPFQPQLLVYDIGANPWEIGRYYAAAQQRGADLIIGPLGKDYADSLAQISLSGFDEQSNSLPQVPTLLLGGEAPLGPTMMRLSLSPERESKHVVERALSRGFVNVAILAPTTEKGTRTANAFTSQWLANGGKISKVITYSPSQFDHSTELRLLFSLNESEARYSMLSKTLGYKPEFSPYRREDIDFIFMIADNQTGRILRPQINFFSGNRLPVMSTSEIYNGIQARAENMDLNDTAFPVMPWVLATPEVAVYAGLLNELFALGSDAYQLAGELQNIRNNSGRVIKGNTGDLTLDVSGEVISKPVWAVFNDGMAESEQELAPVESPLLLNESYRQNRTEGNRNNGVKSYDESNWDPRQSRRKPGT